MIYIFPSAINFDFHLWLLQTFADMPSDFLCRICTSMWCILQIFCGLSSLPRLTNWKFGGNKFLVETFGGAKQILSGQRSWALKHRVNIDWTFEFLNYILALILREGWIGIFLSVVEGGREGGCIIKALDWRKFCRLKLFIFHWFLF